MPKSSVKRVVPGVPSTKYAELSESELAALVVCHDTLGRPEGAQRRVTVSRCSPCVPFGVQADPARASAHARRLWLQRARAPYDTLDVAASCVGLNYGYARALAAEDDSLLVDYTLFKLADERPAIRAEALRLLDTRLRDRQDAGENDKATRLLDAFAAGIWERAQRLLERPTDDDVEIESVESHVHDLANDAPVLARLPAIPRTSRELGVSEAEWAARLYAQLAKSTATSDARARYTRLALAPWVATNNWRALDSAAQAMRRWNVPDSVILPAVALAAFHRIVNPVLDAPRVSALFDSALRAMPRVDSLRYDTFDGVLTASDDAWRYGFLPTDRLRLDSRGWAVLDPLWSTPVNEIRLTRRARVAEADYRYADAAPAGQSGAETDAGQMLIRLGTPQNRWALEGRPNDGYQWYLRAWETMGAIALVSDLGDSWRVFYGRAFDVQRATRFKPGDTCTDGSTVFATMIECATNRRSVWWGVPFYGETDTVDVSVARFRARGDSVDVYVGARVPLRSFRHRDAESAKPTDRLRVGMWLTTALGEPVVHQTLSEPLPDQSQIARYAQWTGRVGSQSMMHRVEALDPDRPAGARGAAQFNSTEQVSFPTKGFGMSDVLIAATVKPSSQRVPLQWTDLTITPNAGVVAPGQHFALAWENYDLKPGPDGRVRWRVQIKRERGKVVVRDDMKDMLTGSARAGTKVVANETDAPDVSFTRDAPASGVTVDFLSTFSFDRVPVGKHVLRVQVEDLIAHTKVSRSVSVRVLAPDSQRRGTLLFPSPTRTRAR